MLALPRAASTVRVRRRRGPGRGRSAGAVVAGCILVIAVAGCGRSESVPPPPPASLGTITDIPVPAAVEDAPLVDAKDHRTSLAAWQGKTVVLADFLTLCQEICPMTSANFAQMAAAVDHAGLSKRVEFVELTVDPARDRPARLAAYRKMFAARANWALLTGSKPAIAAIWKQFGVDYEPTPVTKNAARDWWTGKELRYDVDHTDAVIFINAAGHQRFLINAAPNTTGHRPPRVLTRFLDDQGRRHLTRPDPAAWTTTQALRVTSWLVRTRIAG